MGISRRTLLRHLASGAAASAAIPSIARAAQRFDDAKSVVSGGTAGAPLRLHLGENGYGASPKALAAIRTAGVASVSRYPDAAAEALRNKIAETHGVHRDQVVVGCGSREILRMAAAAFAGPGRPTVTAQPTCPLIAECARAAGAEVAAAPLRSNHAHDLDGMLASGGNDAGLFYICNPNNPTGSLTRRVDIEALIRRLPGRSYLLIDEAYHHYVGGSSEYASFIDRPVDNPRVIVARSFSTIHGLAGLRVGYAVASRDAVQALQAARLSNGVNAMGAAAAIAALADTEHVRASASRNADERQEFCNQANARMLRTIDSQANFVMLDVGRPAADTIAHFRTYQVLVAGPFPAFDHHIRVSIGTPADMREFWRVWDLLPPMHAMRM
jgi:histidinol-phosphate aminotransferase